MTRIRRRSTDSFVLLEIMLGVAIFAIGILALGQCVTRCLNAEIIMSDTQRARLALENRMAEIESDAVVIETSKSEELKGMFEGITLNQTKTPLGQKNEKDQDLPGLFNIELEATWKRGNEPQSSEINFYVYRPK